MHMYISFLHMMCCLIYFNKHANSTGFSSKLPEEVEVPQSPDKVVPAFPLLARDLLNFSHLLTAEDARVMVDLLKLAVARRLGERGKETLGAVLTTMAKTNTEV